MSELHEISPIEIRGTGHCSSCFIRLLDSISLAVSIALYIFEEISLPSIIKFNLLFKFLLEIRREAHKQNLECTSLSKQKGINYYMPHKHTGEIGKRKASIISANVNYL